MVVRVKPVKQKQPTEPTKPENAVHYYRRAIDAGPRPTGSFLGAFIRHAEVDTFYCQSQDSTDYDDFVSRVVRAYPEGHDCRFVAPGDTRGFAEAPVLRIADPAFGPLMWRRRTLGQRRYSIVGEVSSLGAHEVQRALSDLLIAPAQPWDAMIYPSKTIKSVAEDLIARASDYLQRRVGGTPSLPLMGFIIPPGIDAAKYAEDDESARARAGVRRRLGIGDEDLCVLTTGLFQFYRRAHPTPLILALEAAARRTGVRLHLLQAGWFDNERIERSYRDALREWAPAVNAIFLDGREPDIRDRVWQAADVYAAFDDSVVTGVDTEILEAMASGLPVVAADWSGNRDIVRDGEDGYLVPTWLPLAESGADVTLSPEGELTGGIGDRADILLAGTVGQTTAVDLRVAAEAFEALANDSAHRRKMSAAARSRAEALYDWPVVIRRHQALWSELRRLRGEAVEVAAGAQGQSAIPHLDDPFTAFAGFASHMIDERTEVRLSPGIRSSEGIAAHLVRLKRNPINDVAGNTLLSEEEQTHLLQHLSEREGIEVIRLAELLVEDHRYRLPRTLGWLAKMGVVRLRPGEPLETEDDVQTHDERGALSLIDLGVAARHQGALENAAGYFRSALEHDPNDISANINLGEMYADAGQLDAARPFFERAVAANPTAVDARLDLGKTLILSGQPGEGISTLQQALDLAPENPEIHYLLGVAYRRAGAAEDAVKALERCLRLDPKRADALTHLGFARKSAGRRAEAMQAFRDAERWGVGNLTAKAGEMSLSVERDSRRLLERNNDARRVALQFSGAHQFRPMADLFETLKGQHWPLITEDGRELKEFRPDVCVVGGTQTPDVRGLLPNALIIAAPSFLATQNRLARVADGADIVCAPSQTVADAWIAQGHVRPDQIRVVGHLPLDHLYRGQMPDVPAGLPDTGPVVLYAPGSRPDMSSAALLGEDVAMRIRGAREDVTVLIKPHPETFARTPQWIDMWRRVAADDDGVVLVEDPSANVYAYMHAADVLVTDVSSVMFEFLAFDRPVVLMRNPAATRDKAAYDPQGIEWRWREVGREVHDPNGLAREVTLALKSPDAGADLRARYRGAVFGAGTDGGVATRIVDLIGELST